jgi:hypothetical protein
MAELAIDVKTYINGLSDTIIHTSETNLTDTHHSSSNIINNNVFNKFFIIECNWNKSITIPSLFSETTMKNLIESDIQRGIKQLYSGRSDTTNHRGMTSILKYMYNYTDVCNGCVRHVTNKGEVYYTYGNIIFDKDFNPLIIPCYEVRILEDGRWEATKIVYKISSALYSNAEGIDCARRFITTKVVPYLASKRVLESCYTRSTVNQYQGNLPIKVEIEDLSNFICSPMEPSENFSEEANAILDALVEDIIATSM